jgi:hypothetical protein
MSTSDSVLELDSVPTIRKLLENGVIQKPQQDISPNNALLDKVAF